MFLDLSLRTRFLGVKSTDLVDFLSSSTSEESSSGSKSESGMASKSDEFLWGGWQLLCLLVPN